MLPHQIASKEVDVPHQYILKPVSGESRVMMKKKYSKEVAKTEAQVFFDEIGFVLDDDQYRDALSMLDLFHFYTRTHMVGAGRRSSWERLLLIKFCIP
jgi:vacuolar protein sorting-associated protein 13A/C